MILALIVAGIVGLMAAAVFVLAQAQARGGEEDFAERVGQTATGELVDELAGLRNLQQIRNPVTRYICHRFWGAGFDLQPANVYLLLGGFAAFAVLIMLIEPLAGLALILAAVGLVHVFLQQRVNARRRKIIDQMPEFLEYVMRSLTAGNTLEESLQSAALESADPIRSLFLSVSRQVRLGATVESTLAEAATVQQVRALHILAMSARVNRRFGGSMRRVVKSLINTIRTQDAAYRELKALTGETRVSAWVVAAMPIGISAFFYFSNPAYYTDMLAGPVGKGFIVVALLLQVAGIFIIWRMLAGIREANL
jgi:tight adherence protein B